MSAATLTQQLLAEVRRLREAQDELQARSNEFAAAERDYRWHSAAAYLESDGRNTDERQAKAETVKRDGRSLAEARFARDMARGLRESALEAVRSSRQVISAIQSLIALDRSEAELLRYAPQEAIGA